jgi:hypothetical protein
MAAVVASTAAVAAGYAAVEEVFRGVGSAGVAAVGIAMAGRVALSRRWWLRVFSWRRLLRKTGQFWLPLVR